MMPPETLLLFVKLLARLLVSRLLLPRLRLLRSLHQSLLQLYLLFHLNAKTNLGMFLPLVTTLLLFLPTLQLLQMLRLLF